MPVFNWLIYKELNPNLKNKGGLEDMWFYISHYNFYKDNKNTLWNIYQIYPDFNPNQYRLNYIDLQRMKKIELEVHWMVHGRKEGRTYKDLAQSAKSPAIASKRGILEDFCPSGQKSPAIFHVVGILESLINQENKLNNVLELTDDEITFLQDFNPELMDMNREELNDFYRKIILNNNKTYSEYNYIIKSYSKDIDKNEPNYNKIKDNNVIHELLDKEQIINKFWKKFYIYDNKTFNQFYNDFDVNFYREKYFKMDNSINDYELMKHYHLIGNKKGYLINDKFKIIIFSPPFDIKCGGIVTLHHLAHLINKLNHPKVYSKLFIYNNIRYDNIFCNDFAHPFEINENTLCVYWEVIKKNPLNSNKYIRWILLELGKERPIDWWKNWEMNDLIYHWESENNLNLKKLSTPWFNSIFTLENLKKRNKLKTCFLIKKGHFIHKKINFLHNKNSINLDNINDLNEIKNIFNKCSFFFCYDPYSAYIIYAAVCGCIPIIYPIQGISKEVFFNNSFYNKNGNLYNEGICYGFNDNEIKKANSVILKPKYLENYYKNLFNLYNLDLIHFINDVINYMEDTEFISKCNNIVGKIYNK